MQSAPESWWWISILIAMWGYGLWPTFYPEHYRRTALRYVRSSSLANGPLSSPRMIRIVGIIFTIILGSLIVVDVVGHFAG